MAIISIAKFDELLMILINVQLTFLEYFFIQSDECNNWAKNILFSEIDPML